MVERYVRDVEAAGSNPVTPIFSCKNIGFSGVDKAIFKQMFVLPGVTSTDVKIKGGNLARMLLSEKLFTG